jgi:hypothetical protein
MLYVFYKYQTKALVSSECINPFIIVNADIYEKVCKRLRWNVKHFSVKIFFIVISCWNMFSVFFRRFLQAIQFYLLQNLLLQLSAVVNFLFDIIALFWKYLLL